MFPGFTLQPGSNNPMAAYLQSVENLTGQQGQSLVGAGQGLIGAGEGLTQSGLPYIGAGQSEYSQSGPIVSGGMQTTASGTSAMAPGLDYLTRLVKGDQADVNQAIAPEEQRLNDQYSAIRNMISSGPRGGGKEAALAAAPYQKADTEAGLISQKRQAAAGELGQEASTLAGIGLEESQLGLGVGSQGLQESGLGLNIGELGLNESQLGLGESSLGITETLAGLTAALTQRGQNVNQQNNNLTLLTQGLSGLI